MKNQSVCDRIKVVRGSIVELTVDAIVNAANSSLMGGGGVDGAIHRAGGPSIVAECREIVAKQGPCSAGNAVITGGGLLPARYVIHTVGPIWRGGANDEPSKLACCYRNSLKLAVAHGCKKVAFPNISTGVYGYPKPQAALIAVKEVVDFLLSNQTIDEVVFVCFDGENKALIDDALNSLVGR